MRSTRLNNFNARFPPNAGNLMLSQYLLPPTDTRRIVRIIQNRHEAPAWQSYRRSVSGANCSFVALWMLAIRCSRYSVICAFPPVALSFMYFLRKVSNRIYSCPKNRRIWKLISQLHSSSFEVARCSMYLKRAIFSALLLKFQRLRNNNKKTDNKLEYYLFDWSKNYNISLLFIRSEKYNHGFRSRPFLFAEYDVWEISIDQKLKKTYLSGDLYQKANIDCIRK